MKRCPECRRDYYDDSLLYCLEDGAELVQGAVPSPADSQTAVLSGTAATLVQRTDHDASGPSYNDRGKKTSSVRRTLFPVSLIVLAIALAGYGGYRYFGTVTTSPIRSIAVLPFENRSGSPDADYLSDGLTDSLIFRFSQLPGLKVSPTSSVMRYRGKEGDLDRVASELGVDSVLSGRLMQLGENLTISVELIDVRTKELVWKEQYERRMSDLLATQREIATTLTQKMQLNLAADERGIAKKYTNSSDAYQLYMKGRYHWSRRGKNDLLKAIESYKTAIEIDPTFALAYAGIAEAYNSLAKNPHLAPKESVPFAKAAAARALEIDPTLQQAHSALADSLAIYDWDWSKSEEHFKKAIELDPNVSYTHLVYGASYLSAVNKPEEALLHEQKAVELEPLSLINNAVLVSGYLNARQYEKALAQARATHELDPTFPFTRHWLGFALIANGSNDEAIKIASESISDPSIGWLSTVVLAQAYATSGNRAEAEREIEKLRELSETSYVRTFYFASIYAALGDKDKAFAALESSFEDRDSYLGRAPVDPFLDPLRDDPRFSDLLRRMGLTQ